MKILFVEPPLNIYKRSKRYNLSVPLLWMLALAAYLKEKNKKITIKNLDGQILNLETILKELNKIKPDVVGICPKHYSYLNALIIARAAKKLGAKVVMGGPHASFLAKEILLNRGPGSGDYCVDVCIYGDGEKAFYEYISGKNPRFIKNLIFSERNKIIENPREYLNLNNLPPINRDLIDFRPYLSLIQEKFPGLRPFAVYSHKGCFYGNLNKQACVFCGGDKKLRLRSPENFWKEVNNLVKQYNATNILNFTDSFPLDLSISWFREFYKSSFLICKNKPRLHIRTLPYYINSKTIKILKDLNVVAVRLPITGFFPGCAFGFPRSFKNKYLERVFRSFKLLSRAGISVTTYFQPMGRLEDLKKIIKLGRILSELSGVNIIFARGYSSMPGSRGWQMLQAKVGGKYKNQDLIDWTEASKDWIKNFSDEKLFSLIKSIEKNVPNVKEEN